MHSENIGFVGGGNMAASLVSGLIASGHSPQKIWVSDLDETKLQNLNKTLEVNVTTDNSAVVRHCDVVVLAVKPQALRAVAENISGCLQEHDRLVISIAAGINQQSLAAWLGNSIAIVRCMPNTPALVQTGATALHANNKVLAEHRDFAENILRAVGITVWVDTESELDAVTAVSGSGPAYFFLLMEAMQKAALEMGLSEEIASLLVQQTALGAAKIALESPDSPGQLRANVTSPGGTTQRAIEVFQQGGFEGLVVTALKAARERSIEMSKELGEK